MSYILTVHVGMVTPDTLSTSLHTLCNTRSMVCMIVIHCHTVTALNLFFVLSNLTNNSTSKYNDYYGNSNNNND